MRITVTANTQDVIFDLQSWPERLFHRVDTALDTSAQMIARDERELAAKASSTLTNSIKVSRSGFMQRVVGTPVEYAKYVEHGSKRGGNPPIQSLVDWIRNKNMTPDDPEDDLADLAFKIQRSIRAKGIKPQPFRQPAFEQNTDTVHDLVKRAIQGAWHG